MDSENKISENKISRKKIFYEGKCLEAEGHFVKNEFRTTLEGLGSVFHENGVLMACGEFLNGELHGKGEIFYDNGQLEASGHFERGMPDGECQTYYRDGTLESDGTFDTCYCSIGRGFDMHGRWRNKPALYMTLSCGKLIKYEGVYLFNANDAIGHDLHDMSHKKINDVSKLKFPIYLYNKIVYEGSFYDGVLDGRGRVLIGDKIIEDGYYDKGKLIN